VRRRAADALNDIKCRRPRRWAPFRDDFRHRDKVA
jgi:hypothetical protein